MINLEFCNDIACIYFDPIFSALLVGLLVYVIDIFRTKIKSKKRFGKIAGDYEGFGYLTEEDTLNIKTTPQTLASIKYLKDNLLEISVTENPNKNLYEWKGIISLELENYGSIAWRYVIFKKEKLGEYKHKFGIKKILINESEDFIYLYVAESDINDNKKFGREIFKRKKASS